MTIRPTTADDLPAINTIYNHYVLTSTCTFQVIPTPDEDRLKQLILNCLEEHYGSLAGCVVDPDRATMALRNMQAELDRVKDLL